MAGGKHATGARHAAAEVDRCVDCTHPVGGHEDGGGAPGPCTEPECDCPTVRYGWPPALPWVCFVVVALGIVVALLAGSGLMGWVG